MSQALWVLGALVPALLGVGLLFLRKQKQKMDARRHWEPWAQALGLRLTISPTRHAAMKGIFEHVPVIVSSTGAPSTTPFHLNVSIMSMTVGSFSFPEQLSKARQDQLENVQDHFTHLEYSSATLTAVIPPEKVRLDIVLECLVVLTSLAQDIVAQGGNTPSQETPSRPQRQHIQLAQFLEQNLAMQHVGRPSGWELTGLTTFIGHHVSFDMVVQSMDQSGTLRGPLNHSVYSVVVTDFPIDSKDCPTLGKPLKGVGVITHLNVVSRTAELQWRAINPDYT